MLPVLPDLTNVRTLANKAVAYRDAVERQIVENKKYVKDLENEEELLNLVSNLIRQLIDTEVTDGVKAVEKLQTEGLQEIFYDQALSVRAEVEESRGKVAVTLLTAETRADGSVVEGQSDRSFGGSVTTMQSILMRITVIFRRDMRPLLLLDETLVAVADKYVDRAAKFLSTLCSRLDLDVLLISHDDALVGAAHHAYHVDKIKDRAVFHTTTSRQKAK
jgi:hypothetical protein